MVVDVDSDSVTVERWALLQRIKPDRPQPHPRDPHTTLLTIYIQMFHNADALERFTGIYPVFTMLPPLTCLELSLWSENELHRSHMTPGSRWEKQNKLFFISSFSFGFSPLPVRVLECRGLFVDTASPVVSPSSARFFFRLLEIRF